MKALLPQALGKRLGKSMAAVGNAVKQMNAQQIADFESKGSINLAGETLSAGEIKVPLTLPLLTHWRSHAVQCTGHVHRANVGPHLM